MLNKIINNRIFHDKVIFLYFFFPIGFLFLIYNIFLVVFNYDIDNSRWIIYLSALFISIALCFKDFFYKKFIFVCFASLCSFFSILFFINIISVTNIYFLFIFFISNNFSDYIKNKM